MDAISLALNPPRPIKLRTSKTHVVGGSPPVWPLAAINGRAPIVLDHVDASLRGVDIAYPRVDGLDAIASCPIGTPFGTATHLMPAMTPALAIDAGEITFAGRVRHGFGLVIDHGSGRASHYANLHGIVAIRTDLYHPRPQHVRAGDTIGYVGAPGPDAFKRLHFELWQRGRGQCSAPVDPRPHLATWKLIEHHDAFTPAPPSARAKAA